LITDVPTSDEFSHAGVAFLNLAWSSVIGLALELADAKEWGVDDEIDDDYWHAAQRPLATAVTLAQQGTEFLLKSKILETSPFLLLDGSPKDWPKGCNRNDTPFSSFKTIEAQDLIRAYNAVSSSRLSDDFTERFERLRRMRNSVMHTVDPTLRFSAADVIIDVLEISETLMKPAAWMQLRREFLESEPSSVAHSSDHVEPTMAREGLKLIDLLTPSYLDRYFLFKKRQRRYICPNCQYASRDWDLTVTTAQLRPNKPNSNSLYCFVCRTESAVERRACNQSDCPGNVIDMDDATCLTCGMDG